MTKHEWFQRLLDLLPALIRPNEEDTRFRAACARAYENGWTPDSLARLINAQTYANVSNKPLMTIMQLERIGQRPERIARDTSTAVIVGGAVIPEHWARERMALVRELLRTPDMSADEREQHMSILIEHQREATA